MDNRVKIQVGSFGYVRGVPENRSLRFMVFDARFLKDPNRRPDLHPMRGTDAAVSDDVFSQAGALEFVDTICGMVTQMALTVGRGNAVQVEIGCHRGHHRSVAFAQAVGSRLREALDPERFEVTIHHRDIEDVKVKARDVVPGWPRGRSTVGFRNWYDDLGFKFWVYSWSESERCKWTEELRLARAYHERQQEMVDGFRRGEQSEFVFKIYGQSARCAPDKFFDMVGEEMARASALMQAWTEFFVVSFGPDPIDFKEFLLRTGREALLPYADGWLSGVSRED